MTTAATDISAASAWENEGGAAASNRPAPAGAPTDQWRALTTLAAMVAVWPELSINVRRRIASSAVIAMSRADVDERRRV